ncbi:MAG: DNA-3-methyladenine glycosylase 2 family protein [Acidobacteria bacterium]|nr:DNA-3-methyladenine glycosylase 2 family protein [Acidobacteriota bacterium]
MRTHRSTTAEDLRRAERSLARRDPVLRAVIREAGPASLDAQWRRDAFGALVQTMIGQQISIHAAAAIHRRFKALFGGRSPSARRLLTATDDELRGVGLSRPKIVYMRDLAERVASRRFVVSKLESMPDDEAIAALVAIKGIGIWTAEVFLLSRLGRLDVMPADDLGLLEGARQLYDMKARPAPDELRAFAERWRPYRSVAAWYLWQGRRLAMGAELR